MHTSTLGLIEIASYEGICLRPYRDSVGVLTWGVGHTNAAGPPDVAAFPADVDQPLARVFDVFRADLAAVEREVNALVKVPLAQHAFDALVSFHYNTGGLARARLLVALNAGDFAGAAEGFLGWLKPPEIEGRRRKEMALFRDGVYSAGGKALVFPVGTRQQPLYSMGRAVDVAATSGVEVEHSTQPAPPRMLAAAIATPRAGTRTD